MTSKSLQETLDRLGERVRAQGESNMIQLPLWSRSKRGTPNSFLRSSLFSAIQGKNRYLTKNEVLYAQEGITVKYTGERLNQEDLTLWETLVHLARETPLGNECTFTARSILKAMDLGGGGRECGRLHDSITRLIACSVEIIHGEKRYFGSLIEGGTKDDFTRHYNIRLNRDLIGLFGDTQYTAIDWEQRLKLRRKSLSQFLHGYYSSHQNPYPIKLETLQQITGCRNKQPAGFRRKCKAALDALVSIGFLQSYRIEGGLVSIKRAQVLSQ